MPIDSRDPCDLADTKSTAGELAARFKAPDHRLLCDALLNQPLVQGKQDVAEQIASLVAVEAYDPDQLIIEQGATDTDILFILCGSVIVSPNGRDDTIRSAGTHVGEMAAIDPTARRSVTVRAGEASVLARMSEPDFSALARIHPFIWRHLARDMADRLRQRIENVPVRKVRPRIFIASSTDALGIATAVHKSLSNDPVDARLWTDGIFIPGITNIEALEAELLRADFALLVLSPDDVVLSRGEVSSAPGDNLILELGLFAGALGRRRAIMMCPEGTMLKLPTDFLGVGPIKYKPGSNMIALADELRTLFNSLGPK